MTSNSSKTRKVHHFSAPFSPNYFKIAIIIVPSSHKKSTPRRQFLICPHQDSSYLTTVQPIKHKNAPNISYLPKLFKNTYFLRYKNETLKLHPYRHYAFASARSLPIPPRPPELRRPKRNKNWIQSMRLFPELHPERRRLRGQPFNLFHDHENCQGFGNRQRKNQGFTDHQYDTFESDVQ